MPDRQPSEALRALGGRPWFAANEVLAFVVELVAVSLLGWWGFSTGGNTALHLLLGIGAPATAIVLWALFAAPKARLRPPLPGVLLVKTVVLGGAACAWWNVGHPVAAVVLGVVMLVNTGVAETFRRSTGLHH
jgi:hypothetical protein